MSYEFLRTAHLQLQLESWSSSAVTIAVWGYTTGGPFEETHTTNSDRSVATSTYELHGVPISLTLADQSTIASRGVCFVKVGLVIDGKYSGCLIQDYLTNIDGVTYPGGTIRSSIEGRGYIHLVTGTDPAANTEIAEAVPTNALWRILSIMIPFTTDANVADRYVTILLTDGTDTFLTLYPALAQSASKAWTYNFFHGLGQLVDQNGSTVHMAFPREIILPEAYTITTSTTDIQATDNYGAPLIFVEEWIQE